MALNSFRKQIAPTNVNLLLCTLFAIKKQSMIMGKISIFITKQSAKQQIKHWSNVF